MAWPRFHSPRAEPQGAKQIAAPAETRTPNMHRANESLLESANGSMATAATRQEKKSCLIKTKIRLDYDRPSHGRPLHSVESHCITRLESVGPLEAHFHLYGVGRRPIGTQNPLFGARQARRRAIPVVSAVDLYRSEHGQYPPSLEQLVPTYLPSIPNAGFTRTSRHFRYNNGRPQLYFAGMFHGVFAYDFPTESWTTNE
jgi:hypothetical protein